MCSESLNTNCYIPLVYYDVPALESDFACGSVLAWDHECESKKRLLKEENAVCPYNQ